MRLTFITTLALLATASSAMADALISFNDIPLAPGTFNNGGPVTNSNGFVSNGTFFRNSYNANFGGFWSGFSISNVQNATTPGFGNQYASYAGSGIGGSGSYAIAYPTAFINLAAGEKPIDVKLTNTTYAAFSMKNGDAFAKKFGGQSGNDPDFFSVTLTGYNALNGSGAPTGSATLVLADYRFADNAKDFILNEWTTLDLRPLGNARSISLSFASSDVGQFGINTPVYVALDNLVTAPEPTTVLLLTAPLVGRRRRR